MYTRVNQMTLEVNFSFADTFKSSFCIRRDIHWSESNYFGGQFFFSFLHPDSSLIAASLKVLQFLASRL